MRACFQFVHRITLKRGNSRWMTVAYENVDTKERKGCFLMKRRIVTLLLAAFMAVSCISGAAWAEEAGDDAQVFRPVDCGLMAQEEYVYPFIGLTLRLTSATREKMDSCEVYVSTREDYDAAGAVKYACLRFFATTPEQREESGLSVDLFAWEDGLEKLGVLGVYAREAAGELDELTGCHTHNKLGESADGRYEYYLSLADTGDEALKAELEKSEAVITEMREMSQEALYGAFSVGREDGVAEVGPFETQDVFGKTCTQELFGEYDLTLVNAFTTWCGPCARELPNLEALRTRFAERGVKLGVVAAVIDIKLPNGERDEGALERAQALYEESGAQFPFLIPDEGDMNGRLKGLEVFPESFFVDAQGNIVGETYSGAHSLEEWTQIVEDELSRLGF